MRRSDKFQRWVRMPGLALAALVLVLAGCSHEKPWGLKNITGLMPNLQFTLTNQNGQTVHAKDLRGKVLLLYFGYTHCPDICPTTLADLSQSLQLLGPEAKQVRVLFVTVDPKRDTLPVLKSYVHAFGPQFVGLRGPDTVLRSLTKRYRVTYSLGKPDAHGDYTVTHSGAIFVFDKKGHVRLLATAADPAKTIAGDLKRLVNGA